MVKIDLELEIFNKLLAGVAEEMGVLLRRSSFSPNIRERGDFSCALFDGRGELLAQASHIPVHLGAMPETMKALLPLFDFKEGDLIITNDPYVGGTHLPDITLVKPLFVAGEPLYFLVLRAHHADVGGKYPGSMGLAEHIEEEGVLIRPDYLFREGKLEREYLEALISKMRNPSERWGDFKAKISALERGEERLQELVKKYGIDSLREAAEELKKYTERAFLRLLGEMKKGTFVYTDYLDDDGLGNFDIPLQVELTLEESSMRADFSGSAPQVRGPVNAPRAVTVSAVYYVCISLLYTLGEFPINQGLLRRVEVITREGTVVDARYPAPVSGGNVETSQRVVDVLLGALAHSLPWLIPAASCGSMHNLAFGNEKFAYYETIGGGMGARPGKDGLSGVHCHMTNTMNTPIEALEQLYPVRIERYALRRGSGGAGAFKGGDGIIREYYFEEDLVLSFFGERHRHAPYGLEGGLPGMRGKHYLLSEGKLKELPGKGVLKVKRGDKFIVETPGGGGLGYRSAMRAELT